MQYSVAVVAAVKNMFDKEFLDVLIIAMEGTKRKENRN